MPNAKKVFLNQDFYYVSIRVEYQQGVHQQVVPQSQDGFLRGEDGDTFRLAWIADRNGVSEDDFINYAADYQFDDGTIVFGPDAAGRVPDRT